MCILWVSNEQGQPEKAELTKLGDEPQGPREHLAENTFLDAKAECRRLWKAGGEETIQSQEFPEKPLIFGGIQEDSTPPWLVVAKSGEAALSACVIMHLAIPISVGSCFLIPTFQTVARYVLQPAKGKFSVTLAEL